MKPKDMKGLTASCIIQNKDDKILVVQYPEFDGKWGLPYKDDIVLEEVEKVITGYLISNFNILVKEDPVLIDTGWQLYPDITKPSKHKMRWNHLYQLDSALENDNIKSELVTAWASPEYIFEHANDFIYRDWDVVTTYCNDMWYK